MNMDQAVINRIWCCTLFEELSRLGVEDVCIAPGSRSTPLTLEADENSKLTLHTHFDERGLGFLALGLAKASARPVAIVVTSGTAVANVLPAIAEAKLTGEKLVVLTADRPAELVDCGANQAIVQSGIYSSHVSAVLDLPSPSITTPLKWLLTSLDQVMHIQQQQGGAIHINCPFPEPLYSDQPKTLYQDYIQSVDHWWRGQQPYCLQRKSCEFSSLNIAEIAHKKGVIVLGNVSKHQASKAVQLAQKLGWPLLADPQSGVSSEWKHYDLWLQNEAQSALLNQCQLVLQFGSRLISKRLNHWLATQVEIRGAEYHYVAPNVSRNNPSHLRQIHHLCSVEGFVEPLLMAERPLGSDTFGWANDLIELSHQVGSLAASHLNRNAPLDEVSLALTVDCLPENTQIFFGNSLFVRLVDMFSALDAREVFTNRGASGIDGLIATAAGVVRATKAPTAVFIGDTSLLYDLNSLALFTHQSVPVVVVVTNNDGGAIFDLLPVPDAQKQALYQMPHGFDFASAAKQFKLAYVRAQTLSHYQQQVSEHLASGQGCLLVELQTPPDQAVSQLKEFVRHVHAL
ncbi:2-succinyl-5-enolpyruvyl-6-hydroxy-3-cyclohexene-1-carboxylic-acid synthase [Vibrio sp. JPW-9-11-11]|uniref:2-succinyl-5-enolpyruvyl-6-hydroxy-3- cyclohexene-1-carboxylic-acid synthase n=1 Tax=Vibrio sp. JPW-9-11-11 TaxID=1416532 RepID=UPI0015935506|nr:2-succinyl-5-enolpyruvyl-6-hydroxy-3-cyclohexene-1-carboxylic-acid synthase [Vibrio sp. JPW-9-11-11]NVD06994.1 2-succinyl-5-enolpyruvyl-6-hydroxy-3-cyclohexene-1-carboxylic-acid synthase [Vibrio sp. JPW-9-11-11]